MSYSVRGEKKLLGVRQMVRGQSCRMCTAERNAQRNMSEALVRCFRFSDPGFGWVVRHLVVGRDGAIVVARYVQRRVSSKVYQAANKET